MSLLSLLNFMSCQFTHMTDTTCLTTVTGEAYQPVRLYYQILNQKIVTGRFNRLRCIESQPQRDRWVWYYRDEAKNLKFDLPYSQIPKSDRPVVLAYITLHSQTEIIFDLHSFERAIAAIKFFEEKISRRAMFLDRLRVVNRFFGKDELAGDRAHPDLDIFFNRDDVYLPNQNLDRVLEGIATLSKDIDSRHRILDTYLSKKNQKPLPEIEELPAFFDEPEEFSRLNMLLITRHMEAFERWHGNKNINQHKIIQTLIDKME